MLMNPEETVLILGQVTCAQLSMLVTDTAAVPGALIGIPSDPTIANSTRSP